MAKPKLDSDGVPMASMLVHHVCLHGTMHIELLDPERNVFARAVMPFESALQFMIDGTAQLEQYSEGLAPKGTVN